MHYRTRIAAIVLGLAGAAGCAQPARDAKPVAAETAGAEGALLAARAVLVAKYGAAETERIDRGLKQTARLWRPSDGDAAAMQQFCEAEFTPRGPALDALFDRLQFAMERIEGYFTSMQRDLKQFADVDLGAPQPVDERLASTDFGAHAAEDLFASKIAFIALLNFRSAALAERMAEGMQWSRRQWAEAKLAGRFATRVPPEVRQASAKATAEGEAYIAGYNVYMHHLVGDGGARLFPPGLRLISHWGLRDELKSHYAEKDGVARQRMIARVMERIVRQQIPAAVINNPLLDWNPETNAVTASPVKDAEAPAGAPAAPSNEREADVRYEKWLATFRAERLADPYDPECPSLVARRFERDRQIPEADVRRLLESVLESPLAARVAAMIQKRLGRPLEPFDIWYAGFKPRSAYTEAQLDEITRKKYPTPEAYAADIPRLLRDLGFAEDKARFVADHVVVDPSRGAGHAFGAQRRDDKAHLRTRVGAKGMDYKGYNIAVHEMGHNVEQVFSMTAIDHTLVNGVPNTAFTEALAFVFQARDLELLGLEKPDASSEHLRALEDYWATREIAGVALVDMEVWRWLYDHPNATAAEFRAAVVAAAEGVWNHYYASLLGKRDVSLLAVYSHMVDSVMYTPDYPLGHLIAFQVDRHFRAQRALGPEFERVARLGSITPDAWMRQACGAPLSSKPLLDAAAAAVDALDR